MFTGEYSNLVSYSASDITPVNTYNNAVKTYTYFTADKTTAVPAGGLRANIAATGIVKKIRMEVQMSQSLYLIIQL